MDGALAILKIIQNSIEGSGLNTKKDVHKSALIGEKGSKFYLIDSVGKQVVIKLPESSCEISDIEASIKQRLAKPDKFLLTPNNNTLNCEIYSEQYSIDFRPSDCLGNILEFSPKLLEPKKVIKVRTIHIDCNIITGAFYNNKPSHILYEFAAGVDPGFAIDETPNI